MVWSIEGDGSTGPPSAHIFSFQLWRSSSSASRIRDDTECIPLRPPRGSLQRRGVNQPLAQLDFIEESSGLREKSDLPEPTSGRRGHVRVRRRDRLRSQTFVDPAWHSREAGVLRIGVTGSTIATPLAENARGPALPLAPGRKVQNPDSYEILTAMRTAARYFRR